MLNLTQQERQVVLFILAMAVLGITLGCVLKSNSGHRIVAKIRDDLGKVNLNYADKELLMSVSGIGAKLAERIIAYRDSQGYFKESDDLKKVKGITESKYQKIKDYLSIN